MALSTAAQSLSKSDIETVASDWCAKLDRHAPIAEILPLLSTDRLELVFPEATIRTAADFETWYEELIRTYFDESRSARVVRSTFQGDRADAQVIVRWETSVWMPPAARSERVVVDVHQTWQVERSPVTDQPLIVRLVVDKLDYAAESARL